MELTWKQVECEKCKTCIMTRHGKPKAPDRVICGDCLICRISKRHDFLARKIFNIYKITSQHTLATSAHLRMNADADYLNVIMEQEKIDRNAIAEIKKELDTECPKEESPA